MDGPWTQYTPATASAAPPPEGAPAPEAAATPVGPWTQYAPQAQTDTSAPVQPPGIAWPSAFAGEVTKGVGEAIAGVGRMGTQAVEWLRGGTGAPVAPSVSPADIARQKLAVMDAIDRGETVPPEMDTGLYRAMSPEKRAATRAAVTDQAIQQSAQEPPHQPNLLERTGETIEQAAPGLFPVDPRAEGWGTTIARGIGGFLSAAGAGAVGGLVGGPVGGMLAATAVMGTQNYDQTYQDQIAHGATHEQAEAAAGESAMVQTALGLTPVGQLLAKVPVPLRFPLFKTLVNLGAHGVEFGTIGAANQFAQNYVAAETYDPNRPLFKDVGNAAIMAGLTGAVVHATGAAANALRPGPRVGAAVSAAPEPPRPADIADQVMGAPTIEGAITAAQDAARAPAAEAGGQQPTTHEVFSQTPPSDAGTVLTTSDGLKLPYRWDVAEAADLIPATGNLQPRDRDGRVSSATQIYNMARALDPELLKASLGPDQGAPTVSPDGVVLAGNGRTAAIRLAYAAGGGDPYRAMVERHGFDTTGMTEPVLVRRLTEPMSPDQAQRFAVASNVQTGQRLSATEQAAIDAQGLTPDLLGRYDPELTGGPVAAGNRDFTRAWVATLPEPERNAVADAQGVLSAEGVRRLQGAMLARAYDDRGTLARSLESTDDNTRAVTGALADAAPAWAQLQSRIAAGEVSPEMNVAPQLTRAVDLLRQAREKGQSINDVLGQTDALNPLDRLTETFLRTFYNPLLTRAASRSLVADVLRRYALEAAKATTGPDLFGGALPPLPPVDILRTVMAQARSEPVPTARGGEVTPPAGAPAGARAGARAGAVPVTGQPVGIRTPATEAAPVTGVPAGPPPAQPAGAQATPGTAFGRSAREIKGQQADMELADLMRIPQPGDARDIIPGAAQTRAEIELSPSTSRESKLLRQEFRDGYNEHEKANNEVYWKWLDDRIPEAEQLGTMKDTRQANWQKNERSVWGPDPNGRPVSTEPIADYFKAIEADPIESVNSYLKDAIAPFKAVLSDANGNPVVLGAKQLYGWRQEMARKLEDMKVDPKLDHVKDQMTALLKLTDSVIMSGAPAYRDMMNQYRQESIPINAGERLRQGLLKITNGSDRVITFGKVDQFMKNLWLERHGPNVYAPAKDISPETWSDLMKLHERLARSASEQELARARGSDTSQLIAEMMRTGMITLAPVLHNPFVKPITEAVNRRIQEHRVQQHLNPDLSKYPTPLHP